MLGRLIIETAEDDFAQIPESVLLSVAMPKI